MSTSLGKEKRRPRPRAQSVSVSGRVVKQMSVADIWNEDGNFDDAGCDDDVLSLFPENLPVIDDVGSSLKELGDDIVEVLSDERRCCSAPPTVSSGPPPRILDKPELDTHFSCSAGVEDLLALVTSQESMKVNLSKLTLTIFPANGPSFDVSDIDIKGHFGQGLLTKCKAVADLSMHVLPLGDLIVCVQYRWFLNCEGIEKHKLTWFADREDTVFYDGLPLPKEVVRAPMFLCVLNTMFGKSSRGEDIDEDAMLRKNMMKARKKQQNRLSAGQPRTRSRLAELTIRAQKAESEVRRLNACPDHDPAANQLQLRVKALELALKQRDAKIHKQQLQVQTLVEEDIALKRKVAALSPILERRNKATKL
jgi:hypothetical protein